VTVSGVINQDVNSLSKIVAPLTISSVSLYESMFLSHSVTRTC